MRSVSRLLAMAVGCCVSVGCGSAAGGGSGSGGPAPDAGSGAGVDAGGGGGAPDGGGGPGAGTDGGPGAGTDGGAAGGGDGADGGTALPGCAGLTPAALPAAIVYQASYSAASDPNFCGLPIGDGYGSLALETFDLGHPGYTVLTPAGVVSGGFAFWHGEAWPKPAGFIGYSGSSTEQVVAISNLDESGHTTSAAGVHGSALFAPDPNGGLLAVGHLSPGGAPSLPPAPPVVEMFNVDATVRYGPVPLGTDATVFGAGVDVLGRALVVVDGSASFGAGSIAAVWFAADGAPRTGLFQLLSGFVAGPSTWFETSPLIGGGLALRRMDAPLTRFAEERRTSQWLAVLPSGLAHPAPLPDWLAHRPNTNMQFARARLAYAFSPWAADVPSCAQHVEVVSLTGSSCGTQSFPVDGAACTTRELRVGLDGTVMQMLPASREQNRPAGSTVYTCTLRYWPAALR